MKYLLAFALIIAGCGKDLSHFTGTWKATTTTNATCNGINVNSSDTGNTTIKVGATSDLVVLDNCACNTLWTATSGSTATVNSGQNCAGTCNNVTFSETFSSGTLTSDGTNITFSLAGNGMFNGATCTFTSMGSGTRVSQ